jgi:hypothetical protein
MVATGVAYANQGGGAAGMPLTFVYLNLTTGSQKAQEILVLVNASAMAAGGAVEIR